MQDGKRDDARTEWVVGRSLIVLGDQLLALDFVFRARRGICSLVRPKLSNNFPIKVEVQCRALFRIGFEDPM